ncbi:MFS transporter [Tranquillimonas alkanivorans]|uniref:Predicted arabinose efflux permease, MFS family n=1 Tax=Tranquillimonas alkanivorans TaxID=441119 RepID=A0A1I5QD84_9RHOB|nr:MFS transporter [Tranquillimonas alkanivorans]SFP44258.1 Predicted arabinose efflux permease, MFS family [Tranquillimonas alkanivorans]
MSFWKLSAAGFAATAMTYGPARMGFGLFLPEFRSTFDMSSGTAGLVSSLGFSGFFFGLLAAYAVTARQGPGLPVVLGLLSAALGMALVATAQGLPLLATGTFFAMSSAGFSWAPFNDAVHRQVDDARRPAALSIVSTGTSLGIAAAGATALVLLLSGMSWRTAWAIFAGAAALAAAGNWMALRRLKGRFGALPSLPWRRLAQRRAVPLYVIALSFGTTTAIYISFAADRVQQNGGVPIGPVGASPALIFVSFGLFGLVGLTTGRIKAATGLAALLGLLLAGSTLSLLLIALAPVSTGGVILSAALQGAYVMMMSAVLAFWSERLFPNVPALGFTAALLAVAAGSVAGPVVAGQLSDTAGAGFTFLVTAGVSAATAVAAFPTFVVERAPSA